MRIDDHGFRIDLPTPWEGAVSSGQVSRTVSERAARRGLTVQTPPVLHLSSTQMPSLRGDFGSGAVDLLTAGDAFIAVVEYGTEVLGTATFDTGPMPRRLNSRDFQPNGLQRQIPGQAGYQHFCTENGRPLCLYVVIGATHQARRLTRQVNTILPRLEIASR
ncbi:hypothetical protein [Euzebya tangerina]|uniref:hypothetical protein n=1 Tax=Euzebya tangerina TaxID=591198 RepID=UPI000E31F97E|nr:hypothetical protein [Euzebya tangerina]